MEVTTALLVAMMYITILTFGIAGIVNGIASILIPAAKERPHWLPFSWVALLLLIHLNLFWETLTILEQPDWAFAEFLLVIIGPILLYLTSNVMLTGGGEGSSAFSLLHYMAVRERFFVGLCFLMIWAICVELILGKGVLVNSAGDLAALALFASLAVCKGNRLSGILTIVGWILILALITLQASGVIS